MRFGLALSVAFALAACGRTAFVDDTDTNGGGDGASGDADFVAQPDLLRLLPSRVANLVGYWRFEASWDDAGPSGNTLVVDVGSPDFRDSDAVGGVYAATFYDASLRVPNNTSLEVTALSFSVWAQSDLTYTANSNSLQTFFKIGSTSGPDDAEHQVAYLVGVRNNGQIRITGDDDGTGFITANTWHHVAGAYGQNGLHYYVDGVAVRDDATSQADLVTTGGFLEVAQLWPNTATRYNPQHLHGALDELALWNVELSNDELLAIYQNQRR